MVSGGYLVAKALQVHDVDRIFCVAGESYLPVLDALLDFPDIEVVTCRHESGATFMAEAYAQLTGKPGVAFVTRGPGACNGSIGLHAARQSSAPVLLFVGLINTQDRDRESFQEFDLKQMFGSLSKGAFVIDRAERIGEYITRSYHLSQVGRPGPVVLGLPEEVLTAQVEDVAVSLIPAQSHAVHAGDIEAIKQTLSTAKAPIVLAGGSLWCDDTCMQLQRFAEQLNMPVVCALRRQDIFDHNHRCYNGEIGFGPNPALVERIKESDVVLVLGSRLDDITTQGYGLFSDQQKIIHVYPDATEIGRVYVPHVGVCADVGTVLTALVGDPVKDDCSGWTKEGRNMYEVWTSMPEARQHDWRGADMTQVFRQLREELLPDDAIITSDAGNFSGWCHRYLRFGRPGRALAPVSGAMGYAVPTAVAASIMYPDRLALGICGDGGFMMTGQELATALHHGAAPIIMVCNNSMYGTIRMHQDRDFTGRPHDKKQGGTALTNPDFAKMAESYGGFGARVEHEDQFSQAWQAARESGKLSIIEIVMDPRQIVTGSVL